MDCQPGESSRSSPVLNTASGSSNKSWGPSGINYTSLPAGIRGIAKHSGTDQHGGRCKPGSCRETLIMLCIDTEDIVAAQWPAGAGAWRGPGTGRLMKPHTLGV